MIKLNKGLKKIVSEVLQIPVPQISSETSQDNTESWTSVVNLLLISEIEERFNVEFDIDELIKIKKLGDIEVLLAKRGVSL